MKNECVQRLIKISNIHFQSDRSTTPFSFPVHESIYHFLTDFGYFGHYAPIRNALSRPFFCTRLPLLRLQRDTYSRIYLCHPRLPLHGKSMDEWAMDRQTHHHAISGILFVRCQLIGFDNSSTIRECSQAIKREYNWRKKPLSLWNNRFAEYTLEAGALILWISTRVNIWNFISTWKS